MTELRSTPAADSRLAVDPHAVDLGSGHEAAFRLGFVSPDDYVVVELALRRWATGAEQDAMRTLVEAGIDLSSAFRIISEARSVAQV